MSRKPIVLRGLKPSELWDRAPHEFFTEPALQKVSPTFLMDFMVCRQRAFQRLLGIDTEGSKEALFVGGAFHEMLEQLYTYGKGFSPTQYLEQLNVPLETRTEIIKAKLLAVFNGYTETVYHKDVKVMNHIRCESPFEASIPGLSLNVHGIRDMVFENARGEVWVMETKTKSRIELEAIEKEILINWQNMIYTLATAQEYNRHCSGVLYNIVRVPQREPKKGETLPAYTRRLQNEFVSAPGEHIYRYEIVVTQMDLKRFIRQLEHCLKDLTKWYRGELATYQSGGAACTGRFHCQYLEACAANSFHGYTIRGENEHGKASSEKNDANKKRQVKVKPGRRTAPSRQRPRSPRESK